MECFTGLSNIVVLFPEFDEVPRRSAPPVCTFTTYCRSVKPHREFADAGAFTMAKLHRWHEHLMIVDYAEDIDQFRYRLYSPGIVEFTGFDMTGRLVSDFDSEVGRFFERIYRKCLTEKIIVHSEHNRVHARRNCDWHRVLCPVREGNRNYFVVYNYPVPKEGENAAGLFQQHATR